MKTSTIITIHQVLEHEMSVHARILQDAVEKEADPKTPGAAFAFDMLAMLHKSASEMAEKNLAEVKAALEDFDAQDWSAAAHEDCKGTCKETCK